MENILKRKHIYLLFLYSLVNKTMALQIVFKIYPLVILLMAMLLPGSAEARNRTEENSETIDISQETQMSILTVGPGNPMYTMFGHTAIRLQDRKKNIDVVYNYGTFDFETRNFALKFLYGNLNYFLSKSSFEVFSVDNQALGRSIREQVLNLSAGEIQKIVREMEKEMNSEDRFYRYEFFRNNCTTKVRDLLARNQLFTPVSINTSSSFDPSFRRLLKPYLELRPWIGFSVNLLLGTPADVVADEWQQNYLPYVFYQTLANAELPNSSEPLISKTSLLVPAPNMPTSINRLTPGLVLWTLFFIIIVITLLDFLNKIESSWVDRILFGAVGLVGLVLFPVSFLSLHEPLQPNLNLLWALPTHLIIATGARYWQNKTWFRYYQWFALILYAALLAGWFWIPQQLLVAVIPILLAIVIRLFYRLANNRQISYERR